MTALESEWVGRMAKREHKTPPVLLASVFAESEHAEVIISIGNEVRAYFARAQNIPIDQVKLKITFERPN